MDRPVGDLLVRRHRDANVLASLKRSDPSVLGRAFFLPGDPPPFSHLGCTLFRHCFHAAWRYARYHLGQAPAERAPVVMAHLRPYFEGSADDPLAGLILDPGGERPVDLPIRVRAALAFHVLRLARRRWDNPPVGRSSVGAEPLDEVRSTVSHTVVRLGDALIADLIAVRRRRMRRAAGETVEMCSSPRSPLLQGCSPHPSIDFAKVATSSTVDSTLLPPDPPRGAFRDAWVEIVRVVAPGVLDLGRLATKRGLLDEPEQALFLPFDHLDVLAGSEAPAWLSSAVENNRAEWLALLDSEAPDERLETRNVGLRMRRAKAQVIPTAFQPLE